MSKKIINTCYGCEYYHDKDGCNSRGFNDKHCGQDHYECPYFLGIGEPLGLKESDKND